MGKGEDDAMPPEEQCARVIRAVRLLLKSTADKLNKEHITHKRCNYIQRQAIRDFRRIGWGCPCDVPANPHSGVMTPPSDAASAFSHHAITPNWVQPANESPSWMVRNTTTGALPSGVR